MKHNKQLFDFLRSRGLLDNGSPEQIETATEEFRKQQNKERLQKFRSNNSRQEISLNATDLEILTKHAENHGLKLGTFIRKSALAYLKTEYLLPENNRVKDLELGIRRIGNQINQLLRHVHQFGFTPDNQKELREKINQLEDKVSYAMRQPLPLKEFLRQLLKRKPEYIHDLKQALNDSHNDHKN